MLQHTRVSLTCCPWRYIEGVHLSWQSGRNCFAAGTIADGSGLANAERSWGNVGDFDNVTGKTFRRAKSGWADAERTLGMVGDGRRS
jgi:hypothetical protein